MSELVNYFNKVNEGYTVTHCKNGFMVEVGGEGKNGDWINVKWIVETLQDLQDVVEDLAKMEKS